MVAFRLNNTLVSNPINWQDFGIRIFREQSINGLFIEFTTELEFNADGYRLIRDVFNGSDGCDLIDVEVIYYCDNVPRKLLDGYIVISECKFDLQRCIVKTKVFDNNFSSRINNNKSIEVDAYLTQTKNGENLLTINEQQTQMFDPRTGLSITGRRIPSVFVFDYLNHLVSFMSDNTVSLVSSVFDVGGEYRGLVVTSGLTIRSNERAPIVTSFGKLFEALHKKLNLALFAKGSVLYIEKRDDVYALGQSIQINNIRDLIQFIDKEKLASAVNVGSEPVLQEWEANNNLKLSNPQIKGFTFQEDQFPFAGVCNIDSVINLKSTSIVLDTNVIEDVLLYGNQSYDRNVFVIDTVPSQLNLFRVAKSSNPFIVGSFFFYNGRLTNDNVIQNYENDLPNVINNYYTNPTIADELAVQFNANRTLPNTEIIVNIADFEFLYSDKFPNLLPYNFLISGTQWNPQSDQNKFQALFPGIYTFQFRYYFRLIFTGLGSDLDIRTIAVRKTATQETGLNIIEQKTVAIESQILPSGIDLEQFGSFSIFLNTGDSLQIDVGVLKFSATPSTVTVRFLNSSPSFTGLPFLKCLSAQLFMFTNPTINPSNYNKIKYQFSRPLDYSDVVSLLDNPEKVVRITHPKLINGRDCYIEEILIENLGKFETSFNLISSK